MYPASHCPWQTQQELKQAHNELGDVFQAKGRAQGECDTIQSTLRALHCTRTELEASVESLSEQRHQLSRLAKAEEQKVDNASRVSNTPVRRGKCSAD